jgi:hypothetical protein
MSSLFSEMPYKQVIMGCLRKQAGHHGVFKKTSCSSLNRFAYW